MEADSANETLLRQYLLGEAAPAVQQQIEEQLLRSDAMAEQFVLLEEELIDDYAHGALAANEQALFEQYFLTTDKRRAKLAAAQDLVRYANRPSVAVEAHTALAAADSAVTDPEQAAHGAASLANWAQQWWQAVWASWWKVAVAAVLVVGLGIGFWRWQARPSELEKGLLALAQGGALL